MYEVINDNYGKIQKVKMGLFQADALIAKRAREGKSHAIIASDADFFVSIGQDCILIKDFEFKRATGRNRSNVALMELQKLHIGCCSLQIRNNIERALQGEAGDNNNQATPPNNNSNATITNAKYPLFDEETIRLRALIAVILGCDVFVGGANKVGLKIFIDAIIYEPVNEVTVEGDIKFENDEEKKYTYLYHRPPTLPKYLEDFVHADDNIPIYDGPETLLFC